MADLFQLSDLTVADVDSPSSAGSGYNTGDLRRKYAFGNQVSELSISQDPFFRFVSMVNKRPTDDPAFKFTERRGSFHKRYGYVTGWGATEGAIAGTEATPTATLLDAVGDTIWVEMKTDYKSAGNIQGIIGQADLKVGSAGTKPIFFLPGQLVKVPFVTTDGTAIDTPAEAFNVSDFVVGKVEEVNDSTDTLAVNLRLTIIRPKTVTAVDFAGWGAGTTANLPLDNADTTLAEHAAFGLHDGLERARCYVVGSAHAEGSGYPETWEDQPFSTGFGLTQIWKTSMAMTNTARATSLKYDSSEWARVWKEKLIEHKYDIEQSLLFGSQATNGGINYTQGAVDYILSQGNAFSWTTAKSQDDFLDDMSKYLDPRYNNGSATVFFVSTDVYNWLHKLGGYALSNMNADGRSGSVQSRYNADMSPRASKKVLGMDMDVISTVYGDMNVVRNIHLDGSHVKILAADMKHCAYRPLVGNGVDRDTAVYVGVQTLENSGVDRRVDLILTEAGMEFSMPEAHAVWTQG
tara:strand:+ start:2541 stop:4100 length:1560 start_codon:yes stop_codon:yes gene_type:complete